MPDIRRLANLAAEKIRGGYNAPHAARSALKDLEMPAEERERLSHDILSDLSRRSRARRKKNKKSASRRIKNDPRRLSEALKQERETEARHMAFERGDHLLPDP